jgi:tetratricopeptide (TPR) repeat protein/tRNA A-37 threonylcarbamoyl transferase component Bud32|nr:protein kinase [Kofleriaceae bacterium]
MGDSTDDEEVGRSATVAAPSGPPTQRDNQTLVGHGDLPDAAAVSSPPAQSQPGAAEVVAARPSAQQVGAEPDGAAASASRGSAGAIRAGGPRDYGELVAVDPKHYVVGKELARGGMGRIVRARDRRLGRDVAIKELLVTTGDSRVRFEREARITAQLQHPAIIHILEAGTWPTGEPFYVMKLVDGASLDRAIAATTTLAERLAMLPSIAAVVDALAFAHDRRIIHRDLKPANVLVGSFGEIVVIDWGLAKDLKAADPSASATNFGDIYRARDGETMAGSVMGTPAYMPAEQAKGGDVDERADVYALGAMLYHLLSGSPPFRGKTADAILAQVMAGPVRPLGELVDGVPADLVTIVGTAMAFDAAERYPTAKELAADLHRFQTGQLVGAHRYTAGERVRRFARRYRVQLSIGGLAVAALAAGGAYSVHRIVDERDAAVAAQATADHQRQVADDQRRRATTQRDAAESLVAFVLGDLKPGLARVGQLPLMKGVAKQVDDYYASVTKVDALDAAAIRRRSEALSTLGDVYLDSDDDADALRTFQAAAAALGDGSDAAIQLATAQLGQVVALADTGGRAPGLALATTALAQLDRAPPSAAVELARAKLERYRGILQFDGGDFAAAIASYSGAIDRITRVIAADPNGRDARGELAKLYDRRGDARNSANDHAGAKADAQAGLAVREQLRVEDPGDLTLQHALEVSWDKLGTVAILDNDHAGARHASEQQLAIASRLADIDPTNLEWVRAMIGAAQKLAEIDDDDNHPDAAFARLEHPMQIAAELVKRSDSLAALDQYADLLCRSSSYHAEAMKLPEALALAHQCFDAAQQLHAKAPDNLEYYRSVGNAHDRIGDAYAQGNQWQQAADEYRQHVTVAEELLRRDAANPRRTLDVATARFNAGLAVVHLPGHRVEGVKLLEDAVASLHAMRAAGQLSKEMEDGIGDYEKQLAAAKAGQ